VSATTDGSGSAVSSSRVPERGHGFVPELQPLRGQGKKKARTDPLGSGLFIFKRAGHLPGDPGLRSRK